MYFGTNTQNFSRAYTSRKRSNESLDMTSSA